MPFTTEAILVAVNMVVMMLTAQCFRIDAHMRWPFWLVRWGMLVFMAAFVMTALNLYMWIGKLPPLDIQWRR